MFTKSKHFQKLYVMFANSAKKTYVSQEQNLQIFLKLDHEHEHEHRTALSANPGLIPSHQGSGAGIAINVGEWVSG